jgi:hypothetical protein
MDRITEFALLQRKKKKHLDSYQTLMKKRLTNPALEPILGCFHDLDESQIALDLSRVVPIIE